MTAGDTQGCLAEAVLAERTGILASYGRCAYPTGLSASQRPGVGEQHLKWREEVSTVASEGKANGSCSRHDAQTDTVVERWANAYNSRFQQWEERAVVKTSHSIVPFDQRLMCFSPAATPLFLDHRIRSASEAVRRHILILSLFDWLEFTVWLETGPVNDACDLLRRPHVLPWLPDEMRADALKIYTDEAGHAQMAYSLRQMIEDATGVKSLQLRPAFLETFRVLVNESSPRYEALLTICFAIVSETLITGSLKQVPQDGAVQEAVRNFAHHHAEDEARHHHYFRQLCEMLWPRLPYELRRSLGPMLPRMILTFLSPSSDAVIRILAEFPDTFEQPAQVAADLLSSEAVIGSLRESALPTLRMLGGCNVFYDHGVLEAFIEHGLAPPPSILAEQSMR
jgi:hypothetical protein